MKAENLSDQYKGVVRIKYTEQDFNAKAEQIRNVTYCHRDQL